MSTASDLIRRSLKLLGILAAGEALPPEDLADGVTELNSLLGTWANERLLVHGTRRTEYTLTVTSPETIGTGGTLGATSTRPTRIDGAGIIRAGETTETPLRILTDAQWRDIAEKELTSDTPTSLWVEQTYPAAKLWLWPVPTTAATLVLYTWSRIASLAASDNVSLPDGYENALAHALALQVAPMFGAEPSQTLATNAANLLAAIERTNSPDVVAELDAALWAMGGAGSRASEVILTSTIVGDDSGGLY